MFELFQKENANGYIPKYQKVYTGELKKKDNRDNHNVLIGRKLNRSTWWLSEEIIKRSKEQNWKQLNVTARQVMCY